MGQGGRAGSWAAFGNEVWEVAATGGQTRHQWGLWAAKPGCHSLGRGFSGTAGEVGDGIWSPKPCWGQGKGRVEEALGPGEPGWGNEPWWPWNVSGPWGRFLVPSLCCPSAGCSHCPGHREGPGAPSQGWHQPLGIPTRGSMPGVPHWALALFSALRCGSAL